MSTFSIEEALQTGWKITKERFWFLAGAVLITMVVGNIPTMIESAVGIEDSPLFIFLQFMLNVFLEMGMIRIALNLLDGRQASYRNFWSESNKFLPFLGASVLFGILLIMGVLLFLVGGIIVGLIWGLYSYMIIDKGAGVMESFKLSAVATKGHRWHLLGLILVVILLNSAGALLLGIGLLVTIPVTTIAGAAVYRKLTSDLTPMVVPATPTPVAT